MRISCTGPTGITEHFIKESDSVLIGRQLPPGPAQIGLTDAEISGRHARLTREGGEYWIEDLGSTNGTWINQRKIKAKTKTKLAAESIVRIGKTTIKVDADIMPRSVAADGKSETPIKEEPVEIVEAGQSMSDLFMAGASLESVRLRLSAVCELSASLGEIDNIESLAVGPPGSSPSGVPWRGGRPAQRPPARRGSDPQGFPPGRSGADLQPDPCPSCPAAKEGLPLAGRYNRRSR